MPSNTHRDRFVFAAPEDELIRLEHAYEEIAAEQMRRIRVTKISGGCPGLQAGEESGFPRSGAGKADSPPGEPASPAAVPSAVSNR